MSEEIERTEREDLFSKAVKAGKRTYFFDVKSTRGNDYYLTITESKKRFGTDGKFTYEKHKIFLYKEDFEKFMEGLNESIEIIKENAPPIVEREAYTDRDSSYNSASSSTEPTPTPTSSTNDDVNFDDLGK